MDTRRAELAPDDACLDAGENSDVFALLGRLRCGTGITTLDVVGDAGDAIVGS